MIASAFRMRDMSALNRASADPTTLPAREAAVRSGTARLRALGLALRPLPLPC